VCTYLRLIKLSDSNPILHRIKGLRPFNGTLTHFPAQSTISTVFTAIVEACWSDQGGDNYPLVRLIGISSSCNSCSTSKEEKHFNKSVTTMAKSRSQDDGSSWLDLWEYVLDDDEAADDDSQDDNSSFLDCLRPGDEFRDDESFSRNNSTRERNQQEEKPTKRRARGTRFWRRSNKEEASAQHYDYLEQHPSAPSLDGDEEGGEKSSDRKLEKSPRKNWAERLHVPKRGLTAQNASSTEGVRDTTDIVESSNVGSHETPQQSIGRDSAADNSSAATGLSPFGNFLGEWRLSSSEDSNDDSSRDGEVCSVSSRATEEASLTDTIDEATDQEVTEIRLTFQPIVEAMKTLGASGREIFPKKSEESKKSHSTSEENSAYGPSPSPSPSPALNNTELEVDPIIQSSNETRTCNPIDIRTLRSLQSAKNLRPGRVVCCSIKNLSKKQLALTMESGISFHELSPEDLAEIFPKLRTVIDNKAEVIGNCNTFEDDVPAHLQTTLIRRGKPQSLYEYEYESGHHMLVSYSSFGPNARSLVKVASPELEPRDAWTSSVLLQVEVRGVPAPKQSAPEPH
jgi:hypothetical protein